MKRSRMNRTLGRRCDRPEIRAAYREANPTCELSPLLKRLEMIRAINNNRGVETHHICGGAGRLDMVSNLICLSPAIHRWVESEPTMGRTLCLISKGLKRPWEIDADEFRQCSGQRLIGWLQNNPPSLELDRLRFEWSRLIESLEWNP